MSSLALKRLNQVYNSAAYIPLDYRSKFIIMSDCHRGIGNWGDNFAHNQNVYFAALSHYYKKGYTYIELGDGDELWENRSYDLIIETHNNVFWLLSKFQDNDRLYMLYGNHDIVKRNSSYIKKVCTSKNNPCEKNDITLFNCIKFYEGLILYNKYNNQEIFLTHGHQADLFNDIFWRLSRFLVRYLWRPLELVGFKNPTSTANNLSKRSKVELNLIKWVEKNDIIMVTGHTHKPAFPAKGESLYFNDGCSIHPRCITGIEICQGQISLTKWSTLVDPNNKLYIGRTTLEGPKELQNL